jgi:hypothetical protein
MPVTGRLLREGEPVELERELRLELALAGLPERAQPGDAVAGGYPAAHCTAPSTPHNKRHFRGHTAHRNLRLRETLEPPALHCLAARTTEASFGLPALHCTALHCTALHYTALHCTLRTALHCTVLHCTAMHCTARSASPPEAAAVVLRVVEEPTDAVPLLQRLGEHNVVSCGRGGCSSQSLPVTAV